MGGALGGRTLYESLDGLFKSQAYKDAREKMIAGNPDFTSYMAVDMVKRRIEQYEKAAHQEMLRQFPQIREDVENAKRGKTLNKYGIQAFLDENGLQPHEAALEAVSSSPKTAAAGLTGDMNVTANATLDQMILAAGGLAAFLILRGRGSKYYDLILKHPQDAAKFKEAAMAKMGEDVAARAAEGKDVTKYASREKSIIGKIERDIERGEPMKEYHEAMERVVDRQNTPADDHLIYTMQKEHKAQTGDQNAKLSSFAEEKQALRKKSWALFKATMTDQEKAQFKFLDHVAAEMFVGGHTSGWSSVAYDLGAKTNKLFPFGGMKIRGHELTVSEEAKALGLPGNLRDDIKKWREFYSRAFAMLSPEEQARYQKLNQLDWKEDSTFARMKNNEYQREYRAALRAEERLALANKPADWTEDGYEWDRQFKKWTKKETQTPEQQAEIRARRIREINSGVANAKERLDAAREHLAKLEGRRDAGATTPLDKERDRFRSEDSVEKEIADAAQYVHVHEKEYEYLKRRQEKGE